MGERNPWRLGLIGAGQMGGPIAVRLLEAGHAVAVFDTNETALGALADAGARVARSASEVADDADAVFASLPGPDALRQAILGPTGAIAGKRMRYFVDLSTSGAIAAVELARALEARGVLSLDVPVSGGPAGARSGNLTLMASGPRSVFELVEPVLACLGRVKFVGEKPGSAQTLKLLNNLMSVTAIAITSEALAMGVKAGLDPQVMLDVINSSSGRNSATQEKFPRHVLTRKFDFGFSLGLSQKDLRLCLEQARSLGVPMLAGSLVCQLVEIAGNAYGTSADLTSIVRLIEAWSGCEIASAGSQPAHL